MSANVSQPSRKARRKLLIAGLLTLLLLLIVFGKKLLAMIKHKDDPYNRSIIRESEYAALEQYIIAQAKHETANFTSNVYKRDNNMFGMKLALRRPQNATKGLASPEPEPYKYYARFESDSESMRDFINWLRFNRFPTNVTGVDQYAQLMKDKGFYGDSVENYTRALRRWMRT